MCVFVYVHSVGWPGLRVPIEVGGVSLDPHSQVLLTVGSVKMSVKQGDITKEKADAIINSTNEHIDMTSGRCQFYFIASLILLTLFALCTFNALTLLFEEHSTCKN